MSRYDTMFERLKAEREGAFGAFLMLGDPELRTSARLLDALVEGGADLIEVGIPFSDPIADGPVIQAAARRALAAGVRPVDCLKLLAEFRARHGHITIGILTYANLVEVGGRETFYRAVAKAGADSVLVADVPAIEAQPFVEAACDAGVDPVLIAAANTPVATLRKIARLSRGYVYCVARSGVTGVRSELDLAHREIFDVLSEAGAPPAVLGFGISTPEHVRTALVEGAAGVISGSAIVKLVEAASGDAAASIRNFVAAMKAATRSFSAEPGRAAGEPEEAGNVCG